MKLIERSKKEIIGEIELKFIPRKGEKLNFKERSYTVLDIVHSEENVDIILSDNNPEFFVF